MKKRLEMVVIKSAVRGFVQLPLILILAVLVGLGAVAAVKLPEIQKERTFKKLAQASLPSGACLENEILVGFRSEVSLPRAAQIHQAQQAVFKKKIKGVNVEVVRLPAEISVQEAISKYRMLVEVEFAEPNFLAQALLTPNDPLYSKQWNLQKIASDESFAISQGGFSKIAVVDTGVDPSHPDLAGLVESGFNTINGTQDSNDDRGHGTHVAGIAAAQTDNSEGIASVSFKSTVLPVKVLDKDGIGTYADVAEGIVWSADNNSRIINLSLGGPSDSETLKRAVNYALAKGSLLVAAAGNNGNDAPVYPASYPGVLAVSASDQNDNLASFSSFGKNTFVASPGVSITSTILNESYASYHGTSMAAPHLSGLLALTLAQEESLANSDLIEKVKQSADKVGPYPYDENGWNQYFGYGRVNAGKMLKEAVSEEPTPTLTPTPEQEEEKPLPLKERVPKQAKVPQEYSFTFELQGEVENVDFDENKLTVKVQGGTPEVLKLISGNLVNVYLDDQSRIKYQAQGVSLSEILPGTRINVKGNISQNKLVALEVIVQSRPEPTTAPPEVPLEGQPEEGKPGVPEVLPPQAEEKKPAITPRGRVRGVTTDSVFLTRLKNYVEIFKEMIFKERG